jgi:hypothetical protein
MKYKILTYVLLAALIFTAFVCWREAQTLAAQRHLIIEMYQYGVLNGCWNAIQTQ